MMTTANKLTLARIAMIPVFLLVLYSDFGFSDYIALGIFILASLTDLLDGYIARHYHQITDFGKFMDPLADKILVMAAMCYLVECGAFPGWALALVLLREFAVSGMRLVAVERGRVIAAGWSGKIKTCCTMICLCVQLFLLGNGYRPWSSAVGHVCVALIVGTTLYSGIEYFVRNFDVFQNVD